MSATLPPRAYPVVPPDGDNDKRFTLGLTLDVAAVLVRHGYPPIDGLDFVDLQQALFRFLYREDDGLRWLDRKFATTPQHAPGGDGSDGEGGIV